MPKFSTSIAHSQVRIKGFTLPDYVSAVANIRTGNGGGRGTAKAALDVGRLTSFEPGFHFRGSVVSSHDLIYPENEDVEEYGNDCSLLEYAGEGEGGREGEKAREKGLGEGGEGAGGEGAGKGDGEGKREGGRGGWGRRGTGEWWE